MKYHKLLALVLLICFIILVSFSTAEKITVNPSEITIDLVAGDTITINITIRFPVDNPSQISTSTHITPATVGINVSYTGFPSPIHKNTDYIIQMTITTDMRLKPSTYIIISDFSCEKDVEDSQSDTGGYPGGVPDEPDEPEQPEEPPEEPDAPDNGEEEEDTPPSKKKGSLIWLFALLSIIAIITSALSILYFKKKKHKEKKQ